MFFNISRRRYIICTIRIVFLNALSINRLQATKDDFSKLSIRLQNVYATLLTDVTSNGIVNTMRNENVQAVNTDNVTNGCCR